MKIKFGENMKNIHYISHTHWDREWYRSSDAFRIRLTYSFDMLLDIMKKMMIINILLLMVKRAYPST